MPNTILMDLNTTSSVFDDKGVPSATKKWHRFSGFIAKALSVVVVTVLLPIICYRNVPFFKPVGVFFLGRLWDVLNFVILTTAVSIGIINSRRKEIERNKHKLPARRIPGLGAAIFGDMEQDDEEELDLHEEHGTAGSEGHQQKKVVADDEMKKEHSPTASVLQARKLVTSVMSSVTHIASFGSVIERLALNASRSFQQKINSSVKEQLENVDLTDHTVRSSSGPAPEYESLSTKSHIRSSSVDRSSGVASGKAMSRLQDGKSTRRKASVSFDYGVGGGSKGEEEERVDGSCGAQSKRRDSERDATSGSQPAPAPPAPPPPPPPPPTAGMGESRQRSYSISRSVNVIRPSEMNRVGDEEVGTGGGGLSPNEVNKKADAFIAKFRAEMRLQQGVESRERIKKRIEREAAAAAAAPAAD